MEEISSHRAIQFLRTKRLVRLYSRYTQENYELKDVLGGSQHWCDFEGANAQGTRLWGECTSSFQSDNEAGYLMQKLYFLDVEQMESIYRVKITGTSFPSQSKDSITRPSNVFEAFKTALHKKLKKPYPFADHGFSKKGILLIGLVDPLFTGFKKDIEMPQETLQALSQEKEKLLSNSSFTKVVLINELAETNFSPDNDFFIL